MAGYTARKVRLVSASLRLAAGHILRACVPPWGWMGDRGGVTTREEDANEPADGCELPPPASPRKVHPYSHGVVVFLVSIPAGGLGEGEREGTESWRRTCSSKWPKVSGQRERFPVSEFRCPALTRWT
jgi:hypothetical protein